MSVQWKILVWEPDGTPRNDVTVADAVFSLESFSVSPAGSCQEANWMMLPSAVNVRARDIIQLQTSAGGAWTPRFKGTVVMAGNPRSSEVQSYRAVGLKQRFYERVCTQARVPGGDVATGMAANAYLGLPTLVGVNPGLNAPAVTFQLGDRFPALESYGELFDALAATVGQFIVPAGTSYVYDGVTYTAGQTVPAVEWGVDATGQAFFRRPHAAAVNVSEVDTNARVEWVPTNAENVVDAPVLVYASGMVADGWREYLYHEGGENWFDFRAIRLPFEPEMWLIPLFGHSRGHCGVAIHTETGWLFHVGDAAPIGLDEYAPRWLVSLALGPHAPRLRQFRRDHPDVRITTGHMWLDFFPANR